MSSVQCYMCDRPATSREHVPPRCIFPERKDSNGQDLRAQLITVPSCEIHNSKKSQDDEFLMVSLAGLIGNNSIGYRHNLSKVNRAIVNSSGKLLEAVFLKRNHSAVKLDDNAFFGVIWGTPDYERLERCFENIARGLFYHHFNSRFIGELRVVMGYLKYDDKNSTTFTRFLKHRAEVDLRARERLGKNPNVFFYQFSDTDAGGLFMLKMCFFEGADIFVAFQPEGTRAPYNLGLGLIEGGIKTIVNLEGKSYEFN
jgi:hypothetical protein